MLKSLKTRPLRRYWRYSCLRLDMHRCSSSREVFSALQFGESFFIDFCVGSKGCALIIPATFKRVNKREESFSIYLPPSDPITTQWKPLRTVGKHHGVRTIPSTMTVEETLSTSLLNVIYPLHSCRLSTLVLVHSLYNRQPLFLSRSQTATRCIPAPTPRNTRRTP